MDPDRQRLVEIDRLFEELLELDPGERGDRLARLRREDPELAGEVEALLELSAEEDDRLSLTRILTGPLWEQLEETTGITVRPQKGERIGAYRVVKEIGRGGMAVVYLAERADGVFDQEVALKLLQPGNLTDELLRRFEQERQILASLNHPAIARLLDGGLDEKDRPFIVLEYVEGEPLDTYCDRRNLGLPPRLEIFLDVARAVRYAHRQLVVHRDLKPSNILVSSDGQVKLLDFGIAKLLDPASAGDFAAPQTRTMTRRLTPDYASPEQVRG
ncbi:MAG: serine/threonine protein kinase, partial [Acidobacteria bacterium]|nr:serine/threonine protein kinase [Acidobacteriota bacterium]